MWSGQQRSDNSKKSDEHEQGHRPPQSSSPSRKKRDENDDQTNRSVSSKRRRTFSGHNDSILAQLEDVPKPANVGAAHNSTNNQVTTIGPTSKNRTHAASRDGTSKYFDFLGGVGAAAAAAAAVAAGDRRITPPSSSSRRISIPAARGGSFSPASMRKRMSSQTAVAALMSAAASSISFFSSPTNASRAPMSSQQVDESIEAGDSHQEPHQQRQHKKPRLMKGAASGTRNVDTSSHPRRGKKRGSSPDDHEEDIAATKGEEEGGTLVASSLQPHRAASHENRHGSSRWETNEPEKEQENQHDDKDEDVVVLGVRAASEEEATKVDEDRSFSLVHEQTIANTKEAPGEGLVGTKNAKEPTTKHDIVHLKDSRNEDTQTIESATSADQLQVSTESVEQDERGMGATFGMMKPPPPRSGNANAPNNRTIQNAKCQEECASQAQNDADTEDDDKEDEQVHPISGNRTAKEDETHGDSKPLTAPRRGKKKDQDEAQSPSRKKRARRKKRPVRFQDTDFYEDDVHEDTPIVKEETEKETNSSSSVAVLCKTSASNKSKATKAAEAKIPDTSALSVLENTEGIRNDTADVETCEQQKGDDICEDFDENSMLLDKVLGRRCNSSEPGTMEYFLQWKLQSSKKRKRGTSKQIRRWQSEATLPLSILKSVEPVFAFFDEAPANGVEQIISPASVPKATKAHRDVQRTTSDEEVTAAPTTDSTSAIHDAVSSNDLTGKPAAPSSTFESDGGATTATAGGGLRRRSTRKAARMGQTEGSMRESVFSIVVQDEPVRPIRRQPVPKKTTTSAGTNAIKSDFAVEGEERKRSKPVNVAKTHASIDDSDHSSSNSNVAMEKQASDRLPEGDHFVAKPKSGATKKKARTSGNAGKRIHCPEEKTVCPICKRAFTQAGFTNHVNACRKRSIGGEEMDSSAEEEEEEDEEEEAADEDILDDDEEEEDDDDEDDEDHVEPGDDQEALTPNSPRALPKEVKKSRPRHNLERNKVCPYCGKNFTSYGFPNHVVSCEKQFQREHGVKAAAMLLEQQQQENCEDDKNRIDVSGNLTKSTSSCAESSDGAATVSSSRRSMSRRGSGAGKLRQASPSPPLLCPAVAAGPPATLMDSRGKSCPVCNRVFLRLNGFRNHVLACERKRGRGEEADQDTVDGKSPSEVEQAQATVTSFGLSQDPLPLDKAGEKVGAGKKGTKERQTTEAGTLQGMEGPSVTDNLESQKETGHVPQETGVSVSRSETEQGLTLSADDNNHEGGRLECGEEENNDDDDDESEAEDQKQERRTHQEEESKVPPSDSLIPREDEDDGPVTNARNSDEEFLDTKEEECGTNECESATAEKLQQDVCSEESEESKAEEQNPYIGLSVPETEDDKHGGNRLSLQETVADDSVELAANSVVEKTEVDCRQRAAGSEQLLMLPEEEHGEGGASVVEGIVARRQRNNITTGLDDEARSKIATSENNREAPSLDVGKAESTLIFDAKNSGIENSSDGEVQSHEEGQGVIGEHTVEETAEAAPSDLQETPLASEVADEATAALQAGQLAVQTQASCEDATGKVVHNESRAPLPAGDRVGYRTAEAIPNDTEEAHDDLIVPSSNASHACEDGVASIGDVMSTDSYESCEDAVGAVGASEAGEAAAAAAEKAISHSDEDAVEALSGIMDAVGAPAASTQEAAEVIVGFAEASQYGRDATEAASVAILNDSQAAAKAIEAMVVTTTAHAVQDVLEATVRAEQIDSKDASQASEAAVFATLVASQRCENMRDATGEAVLPQSNKVPETAERPKTVEEMTETEQANCQESSKEGGGAVEDTAEAVETQRHKVSIGVEGSVGGVQTYTLSKADEDAEEGTVEAVSKVDQDAEEETVEDLQSGYQGESEAGEDAAEEMQEAVSTAGEKVEDVQGVRQDVSKASEDGVEEMAEVLSLATEDADGETAEVVESISQDVSEAVECAGADTLEAVSQTAEDADEEPVEVVESICQEVSEAVEGAGADIVEVVSQAVEDTGKETAEVAESMSQDVPKAVEGVGADIVAAVQTDVREVSTAGEDAGEEMREARQSKIDEVSKVGKDAVGEPMDAVQSQLQELSQEVEDVSEGAAVSVHGNGLGVDTVEEMTGFGSDRHERHDARDESASRDEVSKASERAVSEVVQCDNQETTRGDDDAVDDAIHRSVEAIEGAVVEIMEAVQCDSQEASLACDDTVDHAMQSSVQQVSKASKDAVGEIIEAVQCDSQEASFEGDDAGEETTKIRVPKASELVVGGIIEDIHCDSQEAPRGDDDAIDDAMHQSVEPAAKAIEGAVGEIMEALQCDSQEASFEGDDGAEETMQRTVHVASKASEGAVGETMEAAKCDSHKASFNAAVRPMQRSVQDVSKASEGAMGEESEAVQRDNQKDSRGGDAHKTRHFSVQDVSKASEGAVGEFTETVRCDNHKGSHGDDDAADEAIQSHVQKALEASEVAVGESTEAVRCDSQGASHDHDDDAVRSSVIEVSKASDGVVSRENAFEAAVEPTLTSVQEALKTGKDAFEDMAEEVPSDSQEASQTLEGGVLGKHKGEAALSDNQETSLRVTAHFGELERSRRSELMQSVAVVVGDETVTATADRFSVDPADKNSSGSHFEHIHVDTKEIASWGNDGGLHKLEKSDDNKRLKISGKQFLPLEEWEVAMDCNELISGDLAAREHDSQVACKEKVCSDANIEEVPCTEVGINKKNHPPNMLTISVKSEIAQGSRSVLHAKEVDRENHACSVEATSQQSALTTFSTSTNETHQSSPAPAVMSAASGRQAEIYPGKKKLSARTTTDAPSMDEHNVEMPAVSSVSSQAPITSSAASEKTASPSRSYTTTADQARRSEFAINSQNSASDSVVPDFPAVIASQKSSVDVVKASRSCTAQGAAKALLHEPLRPFLPSAVAISTIAAERSAMTQVQHNINFGTTTATAALQSPEAEEQSTAEAVAPPFRIPGGSTRVTTDSHPQGTVACSLEAKQTTAMSRTGVSDSRPPSLYEAGTSASDSALPCGELVVARPSSTSEVPPSSNSQGVTEFPKEEANCFQPVAVAATPQPQSIEFAPTVRKAQEVSSSENAAGQLCPSTKDLPMQFSISGTPSNRDETTSPRSDLDPTCVQPNAAPMAAPPQGKQDKTKHPYLPMSSPCSRSRGAPSTNENAAVDPLQTTDEQESLSRVAAGALNSNSTVRGNFAQNSKDVPHTDGKSNSDRQLTEPASTASRESIALPLTVNASGNASELQNRKTSSGLPFGIENDTDRGDASKQLLPEENVEAQEREGSESVDASAAVLQNSDGAEQTLASQRSKRQTKPKRDSATSPAQEREGRPSRARQQKSSDEGWSVGEESVLMLIASDHPLAVAHTGWGPWLFSAEKERFKLFDWRHRSVTSIREKWNDMLVRSQQNLSTKTFANMDARSCAAQIYAMCHAGRNAVTRSVVLMSAGWIPMESEAKAGRETDEQDHKCTHKRWLRPLRSSEEVKGNASLAGSLSIDEAWKEHVTSMRSLLLKEVQQDSNLSNFLEAKSPKECHDVLLLPAKSDGLQNSENEVETEVRDDARRKETHDKDRSLQCEEDKFECEEDDEDWPPEIRKMMEKRKQLVVEGDPRPSKYCKWCGPRKTYESKKKKIRKIDEDCKPCCDACFLLYQEGWRLRHHIRSRSGGERWKDHVYVRPNVDDRPSGPVLRSTLEFLTETTKEIAERVREIQANREAQHQPQTEHKSEAFAPPRADEGRSDLDAYSVLPTAHELLGEPHGLSGVLQEDEDGLFNTFHGSDGNIALRILSPLATGKLPFWIQFETPFMRPDQELMKLAPNGGPPPTRFLGVTRMMEEREVPSGNGEKRSVCRSTGKFGVEIPMFVIDFEAADNDEEIDRGGSRFGSNDAVGKLPMGLRTTMVDGRKVFLRTDLEREDVAGQLFSAIFRIFYGQDAAREALALTTGRSSFVEDTLKAFGGRPRQGIDDMSVLAYRSASIVE